MPDARSTAAALQKNDLRHDGAHLFEVAAAALRRFSQRRNDHPKPTKKDPTSTQLPSISVSGTNRTLARQSEQPAELEAGSGSAADRTDSTHVDGCIEAVKECAACNRAKQCERGNDTNPMKGHLSGHNKRLKDSYKTATEKLKINIQLILPTECRSSTVSGYHFINQLIWLDAVSGRIHDMRQRPPAFIHSHQNNARTSTV